MDFEVSVIIPVYNARQFLRKSIQSALDQEEVKEVLIIDDASTDGSYELLQSWNEQEEKIQLYTHANRENKGPGPSRNVGIQHASCEYVAFLDADDYYLPDRFRNVKDNFQKNDQLEAIYEPIIHEALDKKYEDYFKKYFPITNGKYYISFLNEMRDKKPIERWFLDKGFYGICSFTVKKETLIRIGLYDPRFYHAEDIDMHYRIALHTNVRYYIDKNLARTVITTHGNNISLEQNDQREGVRLLYNKHIDLLGQDFCKKMKRKLLAQYLVTRSSSPLKYKIIRYLAYSLHAVHLALQKPHYFSFLLSVRSD